MNNYDFLAPRKRRQSLFIVEGNHEKNELMKLLLKSFPEIDIREEDIIIYGTNIYMLYDEIAKYYGEEWYLVDVDLAYIVSKKKNYAVPVYKTDFNNIVLIFDYERHDPNFSVEKVCSLQKYFNDSTDVGKLFINYPMIESYQHFNGLPDGTFDDVSVSVTLQPGDRYKNLVKDTWIARLVHLPVKMDEILKTRFAVLDSILRHECVESILLLHGIEKLEKNVEMILSKVLSDGELKTAKYQMLDLINRSGYCVENLTYYSYIRIVFVQIIKQNIFKSAKITGAIYEHRYEELRSIYDTLDLVEILERQNDLSRDTVNGIIMVLNTSVFFVPDYKFSLIQ